MSLAWFHVVFIVLSAALLLWFGVWGFEGYAVGRGFGNALLGGGALLSSAGLAVYAWTFARSCRSVPQGTARPHTARPARARRGAAGPRERPSGSGAAALRKEIGGSRRERAATWALPRPARGARRARVPDLLRRVGRPDGHRHELGRAHAARRHARRAGSFAVLFVRVVRKSERAVERDFA